ncbi:GNAT family N-acetyltransferase [Streptomyces sp. NPDC049954]|uniref:GNAT family N-acetyltransferase n=1 Tax=Streptomyces sp. NPDC049954 TaxID=3155779 RepID=UPI0034359EC8
MDAETAVHRPSSRRARRQGHRAPHWRRDLVELAALFTAVAVADAVANTVAHGPSGPELLVTSAVLLTATTVFHVWWSRRHGHGHAPPKDTDSGVGETADTDSYADPDAQAAPGRTDEETTLWRMRTTVRDAPGSLAALCTALATRRVDILSLQTHPLAEGTVDEFSLRAPASLTATALSRTVARAGGRSTWIERADAHDLVDAPARILHLATRTALDAAELPLALRELLGRCSIRTVPSTSLAEGTPREGVLDGPGGPGTVLRLRAPEGDVVTVERAYLPFTPTEFARARALLELDARLGPRLPSGEEVCTLPRGEEVTVVRADTGDLAEARAMHERCSPATLALRYHGPVRDADRYLNHLLSPRHGRTLAARNASGGLVALGHLLWDGEETEVALLVEDAWQRRGVGARLLERLVAMAGAAGADSVYAVTQASNTGMVAAMRGLGLPLDYQIEEGTLVITARLSPAPEPTGPGEDLRRAALPGE